MSEESEAAVSTNFDGDAARWRAVCANDRRANGCFVYAVRTTGVYCRPGCVSRQPRRANVVFFDTGTAAAEAGYRPCKRCLPSGRSRAERHRELVVRACRRIDAGPGRVSLADLATAAGLSRGHFHRLFREHTGLTPHQYERAQRDERLRCALADGAPVARALGEAGHDAGGTGHARATGALGMPPSRYRRGGAGSTIRFAVGQATLGAVLVAGAERGVCAIALGDDPDALVRGLQARFPRASLVADEDGFAAHVARVVGFVETPSLGLDLPLDIRGTVFQRRVWRALSEIPLGGTASYAEIARAIGAPGSARAVAAACGANPLALAVPCHRVVRSDGGLSGYRWGVERKRALLARERDAAG